MAETDYARALGAALRQRRKYRGMSLKELGRAAGVEYSHISRIETGHRFPSLPLLLALARALDTSAWSLLLDAQL